jgi:hypothetical protein
VLHQINTPAGLDAVIRIPSRSPNAKPAGAKPRPVGFREEPAWSTGHPKSHT